MLHISPTNLFLLLVLAARQEPYKKVYLLVLIKNVEEFSGKSSEEWTSRQKKRYNRKSNRTRLKNKKGDSKVKSNDRVEISDRGGDTRHPWPPLGVGGVGWGEDHEWKKKN